VFIDDKTAGRASNLLVMACAGLTAACLCFEKTQMANGLTSPAADRKLQPLSSAMIVYFLRHADADPDAGNDFDRKLTPKGLEQAEKVGKFLVRYGLLPEAIVSSPVVRARQTAEAVEKKLGQASMVIGPWLACGMTPATCLAELSAHAGTHSVMLVGHEPDFSDTIATILGLADSEAVNIRKASLTGIELSSFHPGGGSLQFLVPVRLM